MQIFEILCDRLLAFSSSYSRLQHNMAERIDDNTENLDGDNLDDNEVEEGDGDLTLLERAEMWEPSDSLDELEELEEDIVVAFHKIEDEQDEQDVREACIGLLEHGDKVPLLQRAQLLLFMACTAQEGDYAGMRESLEEAELYMRRLEDLLRIEAGVSSERVERLGKAIRKSLRTVNEGKMLF